MFFSLLVLSLFGISIRARSTSQSTGEMISACIAQTGPMYTGQHVLSFIASEHRGRSIHSPHGTDRVSREHEQLFTVLRVSRTDMHSPTPTQWLNRENNHCTGVLRASHRALSPMICANHLCVANANRSSVTLQQRKPCFFLFFLRYFPPLHHAANARLRRGQRTGYSFFSHFIETTG